MKVLLIYPKIPDTFWSFKYALKFVSKKATHPPLGMLTVASMMPEEWDIRLIDMNVERLKNRMFKNVDLVFISAMSIQSESVRNLMAICKRLGIKTAAGGPLFSTDHEKYDDIDYLVLDEAEMAFPHFLKDLKEGNPKHIYRAEGHCDMDLSPVPMWSLISMKDYKSMSIQYTRGCPFNCDFCNVTSLFGHKVRFKSTAKVLRELENIYKNGWRSGVFFVDDNFIGNRAELKNDLLPSLIKWMEEKKYPFTFMTQASVNLADDDELMEMMVMAGFNSVFVGIESPNEESLAECKKYQNKTRDMISSVKRMQQYGLQVMGGFIVGFDNDPLSIFQKQIDFIQKSGIVTAMVGLLNAPRGTALYRRLEKTGRIIKDFTGDNTNFSINFIPRIKYDTLLKGYRGIINQIYSPKEYYERVRSFLNEYDPVLKTRFRLSRIPEYLVSLRALFKSVLFLGIIDKARSYYWKFLFWALFKKIKHFPLAITYTIYGFHFRKVFNIKKNTWKRRRV